MQKFFLAVTILISSFTFSQTRLGFSAKEIIKEFKEYPQTSGYPKQPYISVQLLNCIVFYKFDEKDICTAMYITPLTGEDTEYFINKYNTDYRRLNNYSWAKVEDGYNAYVDMMHDEVQGYFFYWHY